MKLGMNMKSAHSTKRFLGTVIGLVLLTTLFPGIAVARQRWPIIGCDDLSDSGNNHFAWKHKPSGLCETGGSLGSLSGIDHAHWKHWGKRQATATGKLVDGLGFEYPAHITAYRLTVTDQFFGLHNYGAYYARLHVVSAGGMRGGVFRGPFNVFLNSVPNT